MPPEKHNREGSSVLVRVFIALGIILAGFLVYRMGWLRAVQSERFMRAQPGTYKVLADRDGDTIVVDMNGRPETVRFIGIDTPETHKENTPVQCYGPEASQYTKQRLSDSKDTVRLVADRLTTNRDRYDRLLRYVYLSDGTNLNQELVAQGYAFAYAFPFAKSRDFNKAMEHAQAAKRGLWGVCLASQDPVTGQWHSPGMVVDVDSQ